MTTIGVMHPGEMGSAVAAALVAAGHDVGWASTGRSVASRNRAEQAGLEDAETLAALAARSEVLLSICPPHAAVGLARELAGFEGLYVDANAISPMSAATIAKIVSAGGGRFVDGGIVGGPPRKPGDVRLYLSGDDAPEAQALFADTIVETRVLTNDPTAASAIKMTYAAWSKGNRALLLAVVEMARRLGVDDVLLDQWEWRGEDLAEQSSAAARTADAKGWRWAGEMEEIADTFRSVGLPDGFHRAAAEVYREGP